MNRIAIIPARSGSKGLRDKNIIDLCGKPLMAYSIEAAKESGLFSRIIVSTDSKKYAEIAESFGAEVMMRGEELSSDNASTFGVIRDVLQRSGEDFDSLTLLQPTSPLRNAEHIKAAMKLFEERGENYDFLVSVTLAHMSNILVKPVEDDLSLKHFDTDFKNYKRQAFADYSPNGAIYIAKPEKYLEKGHFYGERSTAFVMDRISSVDIDDELDYKFARLLIEETN